MIYVTSLRMDARRRLWVNHGNLTERKYFEETSGATNRCMKVRGYGVRSAIKEKRERKEKK